MKFLLPILLLGASARAGGAVEPPTVEQVRYVMGTTATVQAWAENPGVAEAAVGAAYAAFDRVDSLMSTWRDDSVLSRLNRSEPGQWVDVGDEVVQVLGQAKVVAAASGGAFDPTVLPLVRLWGFRDGSLAVPDSCALAATLSVLGHGNLELDEGAGRARLTVRGAAVDLGGIAKGFALDVAAVAMRRAGVSGGLVDLGGNLLVFEEGPAGQVGIIDPSGQYERYLEIDGRRFGHILDARTGWPVPGGLSATVVAVKPCWPTPSPLLR